MNITHSKNISGNKKKVVAAVNVFDDVDPNFEGPDLNGEENIEEVEEDMGDEGKQDSSSIDIDNNITNHLVAECQNCHGIFISAMLASDQVIESINGVCPLCNKDTEQTLQWIIKDYPED